MFLPIERHPLGEQIKLGTFFDASRNVFLPQWRNMSDIDPKKLLITKTPDTKFALSVSMEELRKNNELELNGSVAVDFRIFKVSKSIEFLQCSRNTRTEARVDITCTRKNREQKIPMEVISEMSQDQQLERQQSNATHFVSEVHEGATANITFKKSCNSTKEADKLSIDMSKKLKSTLKKKFGVTGVDRETDFEQFEVNIQCPFAISIGSFDDVMSQAKTLPKRLKQYNNTLLVRLLPIHLILPNVVQTVYRPINDQTLKQLISTIRRAENNDYELESLTFNENFCEDLLTSQRNSFQGHFSSCIDEFRDTVRDSLHELRSESDSPNICLCKLAKSTNRMGQQCLISEVYSTSKIDEKKYIAGLKDHSGSCSSDMLQKFIDRNHPLEKELYKNSPNLDTSDWFNDKQNRKDLRSKIEVQKKIEEVQVRQFFCCFSEYDLRVKNSF